MDMWALNHYRHLIACSHLFILLLLILQYFGDDNEKQYIYKEPKVTSLTELTQRLQRLYTRKFGPDIVQIIMESGKVQNFTGFH